MKVMSDQIDVTMSLDEVNVVRWAIKTAISAVTLNSKQVDGMNKEEATNAIATLNHVDSIFYDAAKDNEVEKKRPDLKTDEEEED